MMMMMMIATTIKKPCENQCSLRGEQMIGHATEGSQQLGSMGHVGHCGKSFGTGYLSEM